MLTNTYRTNHISAINSMRTKVCWTPPWILRP